MGHLLTRLVASLGVIVTLSTAPALGQATGAHDGGQSYWGQWRGPLGTGVAPDADPPIHWSEAENIRFKTPLPGIGYGTPVIWGDRVFLTAAVPVGPPMDPVPDDAPGAHDNALVNRRHEFIAFAIDRKDGKLAWRVKLHEQMPHAGYHNSGALASASAATDGEHVLAFFGSYGLYCLNVAGEVQWQRDFGDMQIKHGHGEGGSPALFGDTVIVNWDHEGQSFIVALDKSTGEQRWRVDREEGTSWATPIVVEHGGVQQVIVSGTNRMRSYDLKTGALIWECMGLSNNVVATPVAQDGMVYAGSSYVRKRMLAIRLEGARGDITRGDNIVWRRERGTPYVPSPLLYGDWLYFLNHYQGFLTRVHAKSGAEPERPTRLGDMQEIYASPVGAQNRIYITDRQGVTLVLRHSEEGPSVLACNGLDDSFSASAAIAGDELYLRGARFLYCIAAPRGGE
ncbi:MAG: PQQ-binding-like beta-propeller repeat protein [Planctomycetota bacterium]